MLDKLPAEILISIIDTPNTYYSMCQVISFGRDIVQHFAAKFALSVHKKKFRSSLLAIKRIQHYQDAIKSTIKYSNNNATYMIRKGYFMVVTDKCIRLDSNWTVANNSVVAVRKTRSSRDCYITNTIGFISGVSHGMSTWFISN